MAVAGYNTRPNRKSGYKRGKKENILMRFLKNTFPIKGDGAFEIIRKLIFIGAFGCFVYFGGSVLFDIGNEVIQSKKNEDYVKTITGNLNLSEDVINEVRGEVPSILPDFIQAYYDNRDFVGFIKINNIVLEEDSPEKYIINYPVYQAEDNEYYLTHALDHSFNKGGAIFADWRNKFTDGIMSANTILYGHNIYSGKYFTMLSRYYTGYDKNRFVGDDLDFYKDHPVVSFDTLYEKGEWKVFACVFFNTQEKYGEVFDYTNSLEFSSKETFNNFILDIMDRSTIFTDVDITYGDSILTLSTCFYPLGDNLESRCVVFARKVREGEDPTVDTSKATSNINEIRFAEQAARLGSNWQGRTWDTSYLLSYEE